MTGELTFTQFSTDDPGTGRILVLFIWLVFVIKAAAAVLRPRCCSHSPSAPSSVQARSDDGIGGTGRPRDLQVVAALEMDDGPTADGS